MSQVHLHMAYALPSHTMLEYIPWIAHCFVEPATVRDGRFRPAGGTGGVDDADGGRVG